MNASCVRTKSCEERLNVEPKVAWKWRAFVVTKAVVDVVEVLALGEGGAVFKSVAVRAVQLAINADSRLSVHPRVVCVVQACTTTISHVKSSMLIPNKGQAV